MSNKKITGIILLSMVLGLIVPYFSFGQILSIMNRWDTIFIPEGEKTYYVEGFGTANRLEPFSDALRSAMVRSWEAETVIAGIPQKMFVYHANGNFAEIMNLRTVFGSFHLEGGDGPNCAVTNTFAQKQGISLGDVIYVDKDSYTVAGIVKNIYYDYALFLPESALPTGSTLQTMNVWLYLQYGALPSEESVKGKLSSQYPELEVRHLRTMEQQSNIEVWLEIQRFLRVLLVGMLSVAFAVLNTGLLLRGRHEAQRKTAAVKLTIGATLSDIRRERHAESLILVLAANLVILLLGPVLATVTPDGTEFTFSWGIHVFLLAGSWLATRIVNSVLMRPLSKLSVTEGLRDGV
jgi:hypothetical protein